ncbi:alpha/beta fold hydrolase [Virgibacillus sp. C22-A2]|uniref:Alpha/beta fold hydrolase n=1 Tax=Virgibacillus tibetensis TaxID=3042313 RepID=A0ABU6KHC8_9BACI|nr:alpha/beta fold hydrolase [Virgibacillus sp. C22-A2]
MWKQYLIETSRGIFEYFQKGNGNPLCVTHLYSEFNTKGNTFALPFTENYSVYLINLKGCGESDKAEQDSEYSMSETVKDLEAIRDALEIQKWGFAGHSTGGMLALKYTTMAEESLTKIVAGGLCASAEYMYHPGSIYCKDNPNNARIKEIINLLDSSETPIEERRALNKEWMLMSIFNPNQYEEIMNRPNSGKVVSPRLNYFSYKELKTYDLRKILSNVSIPAFIYCGRYDAQCPHEFSKEAADLMPNATMTTFELSNHNPFVEEEEEFKKFVNSTVDY